MVLIFSSVVDADAEYVASLVPDDFLYKKEAKSDIIVEGSL